MMIPIRDIKILLLVGYIVGYPLAVLPPILIDPVLRSHVNYPEPRQYPYRALCIVIFLSMIAMQGMLLRSKSSVVSLYISACVFLIAVISSLPIFLPEFPHGNLLAVGITTGFLSAFTIFVWTIGEQVAVDPSSLGTAGNATFEYLKAILSFVRQGAFAAVALFGALFFAAFTTEFQFADATVTAAQDKFMLHLNMSLQIGFYATYSVIGAVRYFFVMNLQILSSFKVIAARLDQQSFDTETAT
jgi:hypothetical protein